MKLLGWPMSYDDIEGTKASGNQLGKFFTYGRACFLPDEIYRMKENLKVAIIF